MFWSIIMPIYHHLSIYIYDYTQTLQATVHWVFYPIFKKCAQSSMKKKWRV
jgi:hypothetical protein